MNLILMSSVVVLLGLPIMGFYGFYMLETYKKETQLFRWLLFYAMFVLLLINVGSIVFVAIIDNFNMELYEVMIAHYEQINDTAPNLILFVASVYSFAMFSMMYHHIGLRKSKGGKSEQSASGITSSAGGL